MSDLVELEGVVKTYHRGAEEIQAVDGLDLGIRKGEYLSIVGPSGSGKTTLLNLIGCVDRPSEGKVRVHGVEVEDLSDNALAAVRSTTIGFVFQHFFLVPTLTAVENVMLPGRFSRKKIGDLRAKAKDLLDLVGLAERADHYPAELSGGEMQRVALARALINDPDLLLADEPTGNLDSARATEITELFHGLNERGLTVVVVTHNLELAEDAPNRIHLQDGKIVSELRVDVAAPDDEADSETDDFAVPEYVSRDRKVKRGSRIGAGLTALVGMALVLCAFLPWTVGYTGYRLFTLFTYAVSEYRGNFLFRTYPGRASVLFTGFWPLLAGLVLFVAAVGVYFKMKGSAWVVTCTGAIAGSLALVNILVIYIQLQPGTVTIHPGAGLWTYLGGCVCAVALGTGMVLKQRRSTNTGRDLTTSGGDDRAELVLTDGSRAGAIT